MSLNRRRIGRRAFFLVPIFLVPITMSATGSGYLLSRSNCLPDAPMAISRNFIDLVRAGEFNRAYQLTARRIAVGPRFAGFGAKIQGQLPLYTFPASPAAELIGSRSGFQSCGNRLRRWVSGRKIDPDIRYNECRLRPRGPIRGPPHLRRSRPMADFVLSEPRHVNSQTTSDPKDTVADVMERPIIVNQLDADICVSVATPRRAIVRRPRATSRCGLFRAPTASGLSRSTDIVRLSRHIGWVPQRDENRGKSAILKRNKKLRLRARSSRR